MLSIKSLREIYEPELLRRNVFLGRIVEQGQLNEMLEITRLIKISKSKKNQLTFKILKNIYI